MLTRLTSRSSSASPRRSAARQVHRSSSLRPGRGAERISTIRPSTTAHAMTAIGSPLGVRATIPGSPLTSTGCGDDRGCRHPASPGRRRRSRPPARPPPLARSDATRPRGRGVEAGRRSPHRAPRRGTRRPRRHEAVRSGGGAAPCTLRRARLASILVASGDRSRIGAISSNGTANMSCSTNARRSAGRRESSTTSMRQPDGVCEQRQSSGSCVGLGHDQVGQPVVERRHGPGGARAQRVDAHPAHHGRQPPARLSIVSESWRARRSQAS